MDVSGVLDIAQLNTQILDVKHNVSSSQEEITQKRIIFIQSDVGDT